jgi:serine/threonine protein kinase
MELVKGVPITRYCDEQMLTPRQRLELFAIVCQAVQHAHQKGIIHCDLKPSNVLIAAYDGRPVPKLIDFGIDSATWPPSRARHRGRLAPQINPRQRPALPRVLGLYSAVAVPW